MFDCLVLLDHEKKEKKSHLLPISLPAVCVCVCVCVCVYFNRVSWGNESRRSLLSRTSSWSLRLCQSWRVVAEMFEMLSSPFLTFPLSFHSPQHLHYNVCPRLFVSSVISCSVETPPPRLESHPLSPLSVSPTSALSASSASRAAAVVRRRCEIPSDILRPLASVEIRPASLSENLETDLKWTRQTMWGRSQTDSAGWGASLRHCRRKTVWFRKTRALGGIRLIGLRWREEPLRVWVPQTAGFKMSEWGMEKRKRKEGVGGVWPLALSSHLFFLLSFLWVLSSSFLTLSRRHTCALLVIFPPLHSPLTSSPVKITNSSSLPSKQPLDSVTM